MYMHSIMYRHIMYMHSTEKHYVQEHAQVQMGARKCVAIPTSDVC